MDQKKSLRFARGFTLVEALVGLLLLSLMMVAFLATLDASTRMAKNQGNISDLTENLRFGVAGMVRQVRMVGTGGLPLVTTDSTGALQPLAIAVDDNADSTRTTTYGSRQVLAVSDVLHVRGVVTHELWDVDGANGQVDAANSKITITGTSPFGGRPQALSAVSAGDIFLLTTQFDIEFTGAGVARHYGDYRILEVNTDAAVTSGPPDTLVIDYKTPTSTEVLAQNRTGAVLPNFDTWTIALGVMDDSAYFIANNDSGEPSLYRWTRASGTSEELVPNISNLQIALGCDLDNNGQLAPNEWFLTKANTSAPTGAQLVTLRAVRISLVGRTQDADMNWTEKVLMPENAPALTAAEKKFRHQVITVEVAPRSQPTATTA